MINFLDPCLNPKVISDKSSMDGYEPKNLISKNYLEKANGFVAYTTVKPPIELDFEFICSVDIHYILIKSTVGSHRSTGLEILTKCSDSYIPIGKSIFDEDGVVFLSSRQYTKENLPANLPHNFRVCFLQRVGVLKTATNLKLRIIRSGKFVPCIGSVEVWGKVSTNCSSVTENTVQKLYERSQTNLNSYLSSILNPKLDNSESVEKDGIPEDFKDDLTYELMTIPMTLPSGKTVDRSTLDKHIASERTFGRKPGDPFTGLKFTKTSRPILNAALKCRIDMFMLQNSAKPEFFNVPRIVGRKNKEISDMKFESSVKKIKLSDGDEIIIDTSKYKFKQFKDIDSKCCSECKCIDMLFILPCKHIYCRKCLNVVCKDLRCTYCCGSFLRSDVERLHL